MTEPHPAGEVWFAQEGAFSAATSNVPVLHYYPARGRAEPIRLALALVRQPWFEPPAGPLYDVMKRELDGYPFRQMPRFVDEVNAKVDIVQSMAILRHLGRKYNLYGGDNDEAAVVDMVMDAVSDLRSKLKSIWVDAGLSTEAVASYTSTVLAPEAQLVDSQEQGPGLACLERLLTGGAAQVTPGEDEGTHDLPRQGGYNNSSASSSNDNNRRQQREVEDAAMADIADVGAVGGRPGGAPAAAAAGGSGGGDEDGRKWFVGDTISIADIAVADLVDMHMEHFESRVKEVFPQLYLHWRRVMGQPGIREYLKSNSRHSYVWGVDWIRQYKKKMAEAPAGNS